ncbi:ATP-dependent RNA helicase SUV3L, mitochondrial-like isoform X2 [Carex rostrata]
MASLLFSLLHRPSPRLSLSVDVLSRLSPLPFRPLVTSHHFSTSSHVPYPPLNTELVWADPFSPPAQLKLSKSQWNDLTALFRSFSKSPWAVHQALSLDLPSDAFPSAVGEFRFDFLSKCSTLTAKNLLEMAEWESESAVHRFLFANFAVFCLNELHFDLKMYKKLMETADEHPYERARKRKPVSRAPLDDLRSEEDQKNITNGSTKHEKEGTEQSLRELSFLTPSVISDDLSWDWIPDEADEELEGYNGEEESEGEWS